MTNTNEVMPEKFIEPLFSKPVYCTHLNIDTKKIVSMLEEYSFDDSETIGGTFTSQTKSLYILDDKKFDFLKNELILEFYSFTKEHLRYTNKFDITTSIKPTNGMFLIFPSEVWHKIAQNNSDITRYSLAINFLPTGFIGYLDSQAKIKVEKM